MLKRLISLIICVILVLSVIPTGFALESTEKQSEVNVNSTEVTAQGTNALGNILADEINKQTESAQTTAEYVIKDVIIEQQTATVTYNAVKDCTLLISVHDEDTKALAGSGKVKVSADETVVQVEIVTSDMPSYFIIRGFMLDEENKPLSEKFESGYYTYSTQELLSKTASDFNEERVIHLEDNSDSDFAVYSYGTVILHNTPGYNIPVEVNEELNKYTFSNPSEELLSMEPGTLFSYDQGNGNIILGNAETIEKNNDNTVTIWSTTDDIENAFEFIAVGGTEKSQPEENSNTYSVKRNKKTPVSTGASGFETEKDEDGYYCVSKELSDSDNVGGKATFGIKPVADVRISSDSSYVRLEILYKMSVEFEAGIEYEGRLKLQGIKVPVSNIVKVGLRPELTIEGHVKASATLDAKGSVGFEYSEATKLTNISTRPQPLKKAYGFEAGFSVGLSLVPSIEVIHEKIAEASVDLNGSIGFVITSAASDDDHSGRIKHKCIGCFKIELKTTYTGIAALKFFDDEDLTYELELFQHEVPMSELIYSADLNQIYVDCPNYTYDMEFTITKGGKPYQCSGMIYGYRFCATLDTDQDGKANITLPYGSYDLEIDDVMVPFSTTEKNLDYELDLYNPEPDEPTSTSPTSTSPATTLPSGPVIIASGDCGDNAKWSVNSEGLFKITGSGDMYDYSDGKTPWFLYRDNITEVSISEEITHISDYAFSRFSKTDNIVIPSSVSSIGSYAFFGSSSLKNINLPDGITEIKAYTFKQCYNLSAITIPDTVTKIGESAFENCTSIKNITIPEKVTSVGINAFNSCTKLETFIFKATNCTTMGNYSCPVLGNCTSLKTIEIATNVKRIPDFAFFGCNTVTALNLPDNLEYIGVKAFYACNSLTQVTIPENVQTMGDSCFGKCTRINTVNYNAIDCSYMGQPSALCFAESNITTLNIGNIVQKIPAYAFYGFSMNSTDLPQGLTTIGSNAFKNCKALKNITIPDTTTKLGKGVFYGCEALEKTNLPASIKEIPDELFYNCRSLTSPANLSNIASVGQKAFFNCRSLKFVTLSEELSNLGEGAFAYCTQLETATLTNTELTKLTDDLFKNCIALKYASIPDNTTKIGDNVFSGCQTLKRIVIPEKVETIGENAFYSCTSVEILEFNAINCTFMGSEDRPSLNGCTALTQVKFGKAVELIPDYSFINCSNIGEIIIPQSATTIGTKAFSGCTGLDTISIPETVKKIGSCAFADCTRLTTADLPDSLEEISVECFKNCTKLIGIKIPDKVEIIGDSAFYGCKAIAEISVPSSVKIISNNAFEKCVSLKNLTLAKGVSTIRSRAFADCNRIAIINITEGVNNIGSSAFANCTSAKEINLPATINHIGNRTFAGCKNITEITIPYKNDCEGNNDYEIDYSELTIGDNAFVDCTGLKTVNFNTAYCYEAGSENAPIFENCTAITEINIGNKVTEIPAYIFKGCSLVKELTFPESVSFLGRGICDGMTSLTTVHYNVYRHYDETDEYDFPVDVNGFDYSPFATCPALTDVYIKYGTTGSLFQNCKNLKNVIFSEDAFFISGDSFKEASIENITIPESIRFVISSAFYSSKIGTFEYNAVDSTSVDDCFFFRESVGFADMKIRNLIIGGAVKSIPGFSNCHIENITVCDNFNFDTLGATAVKTINLRQGTQNFIKDNHLVFNSDKTKVLKCESGYAQYNVPQGITAIGKYAFAGVDLSTINLPTGVKTIEDYAFTSAGNIKLTLNEGLQTIGYGAFSGCAITSLVLPEGLETIDHNAFMGSQISSLDFPQSLTTIGDSAFEGSAIKDVILPSTISQIGSKAFYGLNLDNVSIPDNINLVTSSFSECQIKSLKMGNNITLEEENLYMNIGSEIGELEFGTNITGLEEFIVDCTVETFKHNGDDYVVEDNALYNTDKTILIKCGTLVKDLSIADTVTKLSYNSFKNTKMDSLFVPESVTECYSAFPNCHIKKLTFYDGLAKAFSSPNTRTIPSVDDLDFRGTKYSVYNNYLKINGEYVLTGNNVTEVTLDTYDRQVYNCFNNSKMQTLTIPQNIKSLSETFSNCQNLHTLNFNASYCILYAGVLEDCNNLRTVNFGYGVSQKLKDIYYAVSRSDSLETVRFYGNASQDIIDIARILGIRYDGVEGKHYKNNVKLYYPSGDSTWSSYIVNSCSEYITMVPYDVTKKSKAATGSNSNKENVVSNLVSGESYIFAAVRNANTEDVLAPENLLYIDQLIADEQGEIDAGEYQLMENVPHKTLVFGPENKDIYGDVNRDGVININDVTFLQKFLAKKESLSDVALELSDVDGNGRVSVHDATFIQMYVVHIDNEKSIVGKPYK